MRRENAVFIWVPKCAGTSIAYTLGLERHKTVGSIQTKFAGQGLVTFAHIDYARLVREGYVSQTFHQSALKFTFVRNPYDRAVSLYFYLRRAKRFPMYYSFSQFVHHLAEQGYESIGLFNSVGLSQCNPQMRWIEGAEIDFIGRYESLQVDMAYLCHSLGLPLYRIAHLNQSPHRPFPHYYDKTTERLVRSLYAEDFEILNYPTTLQP